MAAFAGAVPLEVYGTPLPIEIFGGRVTEMDPSGLPQGASPNCQDVAFPPGSVKSRPGLFSEFTPFAFNPTVNYIRTFTAQSVDHLLMLDSLGNLWQETPVGGTISKIGTLPAVNSFCLSDTLFGSEWQAFSDGKLGVAPPMHYDGTNWDRVTQGGPGAPPLAQDYSPPSAAISTVASGAAITISTATATGRQTTFIYNGGPANQRTSYTEVFSWSGAQIVTATPHGFSTGDVVIIAGVTATIPVFNGTFQITVVNSTTFTYSISYQSLTSTTPSGTGGTATKQGFSAQRLGGVATFNTSAAHGFFAGWTALISGLTPIAHGGATTGSNTGNLVTLATTTAHGFLAGQTIVVSGASDASFNGTFTVETVPSPTTLTYNAVTTTASATGITVSSTFNGYYQIAATPSATTFTVNQIGQDESSTASGTAQIQGNVAAGLHSIAVSFILRSGALTKPSPIGSWIAGGGHLAHVYNIPTGPANVTGRQVMITPVILPPATSGDASFYHLATMVVTDNTTTSLIIDFADATLIAGTLDDNLFDQVVLGESLGAIGYSDRMFWWGEKASLVNLVNMGFDGGWNLGAGLSGSDVPLGWANDPVEGAGGSRDQTNAVWMDAYRITTTGSGSACGNISQTAYQDSFGGVIIEPNVQYQVHFWAIRGGPTPTGGEELAFYLNSPSTGLLSQATIQLVSIPTTRTEIGLGFTVPILNAIPPDLQLVVKVLQTATAGIFVTLDEISICRDDTPVNTTQIRASVTDDPENFNDVTGVLQVGNENGQTVTSLFNILDSKLYICKESSLYWTEDDGNNEPALWNVVEVSKKVGTPSARGVGVGEGWAVIAAREGPYIFWGGEPLKIGQEIQPDWDTINWNAGDKVYVTVDTRNKRVHIGAPVNGATAPNVEFVMDYRGLLSGPEIANAWSVHYSSYTNKIMTIGDARKWTLWNIRSNSAALVKRADGELHLFRGNGAGNGKVYDQIDADQYLSVTGQLYGDDGVAIDSRYDTYFGPSHQEEQMLRLGSNQKLFGYLSARASGNGQLYVWSVTPDGIPRIVRVENLKLDPLYDIEMHWNVTSPRLSWRVETNNLGWWFSVTKLVPYIQQSPTAQFRGT